MNEIVEKNGEEVVFSGCCPFCGQYVQVKMKAPWTEEELVKAAAMVCDCPDAKAYQVKERQRKRAEEKIRELFQSECPGISEILNAAVDLILVEHLEKFTLETPAGIKAKVGVNRKGNIKIERSLTVKRSSEV